MPRRNRMWSVLAAGLAVGVLSLTGCGGGGDSSEHVERPVVRAFSPFVSPINFSTATLTQNPTFTNGFLTVSTDPTYREQEWRSNATGMKVAPGTANSTNHGEFGRIVIFFNEGAHGTHLLASSILSADPADPLNHSALLVTKFTPGTGNEILPISGITVEPTRIVLKPANFAREGLGNPPIPLADGQYSVRVGTEVQSIDGDRLSPGPVFMTFTIGATDAVQPFVVNTDPGPGQTDVGAGVPPPAPPTSVGASPLADVRTAIFGPTSPDVRIEFNEGIRKSTINENNIQVIKGGQVPLVIAPAPGFPKLKSELDGETLPSNGHEVIWRADPALGGLPFQSSIQVTLTGKWNTPAEKAANPAQPTNTSPISDLAGNGMDLSHIFTFFTVAPPDVPLNPFPEYSIWWSALDRVGVIDAVNQVDLADQFFNPQNYPQGVTRNVIPQFTDTLTTAQNIPGFSPSDIIVDQRTSFGLCASYVYVMSAESNQIVIVNSRTSLPIALINTPTPGGMAGQFAPDGANALLVTNSSANTFTVYDFSNITPGAGFLNGPIFIQRVVRTGNTPAAITISGSAGVLNLPADWNRDGFWQFGPSVALVMWCERTDGVVTTHNLGTTEAAQRFGLGPNSSPNDVVMTPCFPFPIIPILFAAISAGGSAPGEGKIHYYIAGPGCTTGTQTPNRPDSLVGDLTGFDAPDGLDEVFSPSQTNIFFVVAESGSTANRVTTLGLQTGAVNLPRILNRFTAVGANPTRVAHRPSWFNPCIAVPFNGFNECFHDTGPASCHYNGTEQDIINFGAAGIDISEAPSQRIYVCARGAGQVTVLNMLNGSLDIYGGVTPISIQGVRWVASTCSQ